MTVAALFVDASSHGIYPRLLGTQCWGEAQDARIYRGPDPVVAHPPCQLWVNMAAVNWKRYRKAEACLVSGRRRRRVLCLRAGVGAPLGRRA